jgi:molybdopterin-synthase adenylyltransferase
MQLMELLMSASEFRRLQHELLAYAPAEGAAFLATEQAGTRLVVRSIRIFDRRELEPSEFGELALSESAQLDALRDLKRAGHGVVEVHTHPGAPTPVRFSRFDREQLPHFSKYVRNKLRVNTYGAIVIGEDSYAGVALDSDGDHDLTLVLRGEHSARPHWFRSASPSSPLDGEQFDRQVRALGPEGQRRLRDLRIGLVGLGGTGSQVAQQLAHLGCRNVVLVDGDRIERSNLPRLAGASRRDPAIRTRKTTNARRFFRRLAPPRSVRTFGALQTVDALRALSATDLIIGCVDNDGARLVLSELAAAYLIPYLDIGVGIEGSEFRTSAIGGRIAFHLPGEPCLACADEIDFAEAAEDLEPQALRALRIERGYATDRRIEAALMPLNTTVVGLAMIEFLAFTTGIRAVVPFMRYDALTNRIVSQHVERNAECAVCIPSTGMGDRQQVHRFAATAA